MSGLVQNRSGLYGGLMLATAAIILGLRSSGAINATTAYILAIVPVGFMLAVLRQATRASNKGGHANRAALRYTKGIIASSLAYMLGLGIAIWVWRNLDPSTGLTWLLAMLPVIPIFAMLFVMGRYIVEEQDEYLRHRAVMASLVGLGAVLAIGSFWGFLETFELVPHFPGWWAVPIWAMGMGLGQAWLTMRDRSGDDA
ncbi:hypothetical protein QQS45_05795 [Alteriqipengyuania flavescens]|uniref:hypothetical protein n=1 Tax=Alteriqipengyuania flavescens TaxID=3053610 RepID=UPI0025B4A310|nr:hypothetical protein [Alteriqipengyuania flavescens]WJY19728.1 hypothetical protein QQW98_05790 [Alteriqipengyuania flavescens]WJY25668.1 hypothetical protein QQS45_05795 [Alteriqipengyuania flavescens]